MKEHLVMNKRMGALIAAAAAASTLVLSGCGGEFRAERNGKKLGDAICDVKTADNADEARRQLNDVEREMRDLQRIVGRPINEDVGDINENLSDLVEHVVQGNSALARQDVAVIQRNLHAVGRTLTGKARAAYDGIEEGLADCD